MNSLFDLSGKVALITGAYRGLGFSIAQGLAREMRNGNSALRSALK